MIGCIISVQIGYCATSFIPQLWLQNGAPGLPSPVVTFSMYIIILDVINMYWTNIDSFEQKKLHENKY